MMTTTEPPIRTPLQVIDDLIASYDGHAPATDYQRGHLSAALELREAIAGSLDVSGNAQLLLGYIAVGVDRPDDPIYRTVSAEPRVGAIIVERGATANRFLVTVSQVSGVE